jgi:hypothetical protein
MFRQHNSHNTETIMPLFLTLEEYEARTGGEAFCIDCGEQYPDYLEPDADEVLCEDCGTETVYGIENLLVMGLIS